MNPVGSALAELRANGLYRELRCGQGLIDFASNDYLGLSRSPEVARQLIQVINSNCPLGSTGSRLLSGQTEHHEDVESYLSLTFQSPSALLFSSGYAANMGLMVALGHVGAEFFSDELNHASLIDGIRLTKSQKTIYRHNDLNDADEKLSISQSRMKVIVTESVFSQDGDLAPIKELIELGERHDAWLVVDEAHATGVLGRRGLGALDESAFSKSVQSAPSQCRERVVGVHTGGKALGAQGAFVTSSREIRELLVNLARSFVYSTALSPLSAHHLRFALNASMQADASRKRIHRLRESFGQALSVGGAAQVGSASVGGGAATGVTSATGLVGNSGRVPRSQIVPVVLGSNDRVVRAQKVLHDKGFDVRAIRSPTVAKGTERLRITLKSFNRESEIFELADSLKSEGLL